LIGNADAFISQSLKLFKVLNLVLDRFGGFRRDALAKLFALVKALEDKIRPLGDSFADLSFAEHLPAQGAPAEPIDGLKLRENGVALSGELSKVVSHGHIVSI
jgi:hypothetical protein